MNRVIIKLGFSYTRDDGHGVWKQVNTEKVYKAEITSHKWYLNREKDTPNVSYKTGESFSVLMDSFLQENLGYITYVVLNGVKWDISSIDVQRPRVHITPGGMYHG